MAEADDAPVALDSWLVMPASGRPATFHGIAEMGTTESGELVLRDQDQRVIVMFAAGAWRWVERDETPEASDPETA